MVVDYYVFDMLLLVSKNYMDLKFVVLDVLLFGCYFKLIEVVVDYICEMLFLQDLWVEGVMVKIIKLVISEKGEKIGIMFIWECC